ncbi:RHS repeat-associated core domain-containing protein [Streptomyces sp. NPDC091281]|uniref:RHS repeat-associated core domain-containing protein n=1 Tax=Streptomyces sp. NPDC091281 TaxID=3365985 RepID=UPI0038140A63
MPQDAAAPYTPRPRLVSGPPWVLPTELPSRGPYFTAPPPYRFAGNYHDPTGLYHLKARYNDANIGRFTQPDPSGREKNPYLYAEGDPVNRIDPDGTASWDALGPVGDLIQAGSHLAEGDTRALWGDVAGFAAGAFVAVTCEAVMLGGSIATGGASAIAGQAVCYAGAWGASTGVSHLVGG